MRTKSAAVDSVVICLGCSLRLKVSSEVWALAKSIRQGNKIHHHREVLCLVLYTCSHIVRVLHCSKSHEFCGLHVFLCVRLIGKWWRSGCVHRIKVREMVQGRAPLVESTLTEIKTKLTVRSIKRMKRAH